MNPARLRELRLQLEAALTTPVEGRAALLARLHASDPDLATELAALMERAASDDGRFEPLLGRAVPHFPELEVGQQLGPFRLERPLGRGGMGEVWLAARADGAFTQTVAIKSPRAGMQGPAAIQRFERERALLAALDHPAIARIVDGGTTDEGRPWLAMEYVEGLPLDQYAASADLDLRQRVALVRDVARALGAAHRRLVLHRDLKPSNVLVRADGRIALLDFGIGALLGEAGDAVGGAYLGTPRYASPEQRRGEPCTTASDVYALAALAREVSALDAQPFDVDLEAVLTRASAEDPAVRLGNAEAFEAELERWLAHRPVESRRVSLWRHMQLFVRRSPLTAGALVFAGFVLVVGLAAVGAAWRSERWERRRAEQAEARAHARLDDVHSLVAELVGGVHDRIGGLMGAVPVRAYIIEAAERHLAVLERDAVDEPRLCRALAEVHLRLAEVRGARTYGSVGDLEAASEGVARAHVYVQRAVALEVDPATLAGLGELRSRVLRLAADLARARGDLAEAERGYDAVLVEVDASRAAAPIGVARALERTRAATLMQRARTHFARGATEDAVVGLEAACAAFVTLQRATTEGTPGARDARRDLALAQAELGRVQSQLGRHQAALASWRAAAMVLDEVESRHPADAQIARDRIELEAELATTRADLGELAAATAAIEAALVRARELTLRDAGNVLATRVQRIVCIRSARVATQVGDLALARTRYEEGAALARAELDAAVPPGGAATPSWVRDRQTALELAECLVMAAELARRSGDLDGVVGQFRAGLDALPSPHGAGSDWDHEAGNVRSVATIGLAEIALARGDVAGAALTLESARGEAHAWSDSHGALHWPLRSEGALEYTLGRAQEALAGGTTRGAERRVQLVAAREAYVRGLAAAERLAREGRLAAHEAEIVGFFREDVARVDAALAALGM